MPRVTAGGTLPKPEELRRRRNKPVSGRIRLPVGGRQGPTPEWPIRRQGVPRRIREIWEELWKQPVAVIWEQHGSHRVVARYCIYVRMAEELEDVEMPDSQRAKTMGEVRQLEDRLLLNPLSLIRLPVDWVDDFYDNAEDTNSEDDSEDGENVIQARFRPVGA